MNHVAHSPLNRCTGLVGHDSVGTNYYNVNLRVIGSYKNPLTGDYRFACMGINLSIEHFNNIRRCEYYFDHRMITVFIRLFTGILDMEANLEHQRSVSKLSNRINGTRTNPVSLSMTLFIHSLTHVWSPKNG